MFGIGRRLLQLLEAPAVVLHVLLVLRMNGVHFAVRHVFVKQWADKKGREPANIFDCLFGDVVIAPLPVQGLLQLGRRHVEEVTRVVSCSKCVRAAAILAQELK